MTGYTDDIRMRQLFEGRYFLLESMTDPSPVSEVETEYLYCAKLATVLQVECSDNCRKSANGQDVTDLITAIDTGSNQVLRFRRKSAHAPGG